MVSRAGALRPLTMSKGSSRYGAAVPLTHLGPRAFAGNRSGSASSCRQRIQRGDYLVARSKTSKSNNQGGSSSFTSQQDKLGSDQAGAGKSASDGEGEGSSNLNETLDKLAKA